MTSGGARNRSGPAADPSSATSERRGLRFTSLPSSGFDGKPPVFPLPKRVVYYTTIIDKVPIREVDDHATEHVAEREVDLWVWAWSTPQACAWAQRSEAWRLMSIAMWVRTYVICESSEATAADKNSLHRFADQIGMSPAGLRENGWAIATDEVAAKAAEVEDREPPRARRLRSADAQ